MSLFSQLTLTLALGLIAPASAIAAPPPADFEVEQILDNGPPENRVNIVILGDGYRASEQELLSTRAKTFIDRFVKMSPFAQHAKWVNAYVIHTISNESGATNGTAGGTRDTILESYYNCANIDRLLCTNESKAMQITMDHLDYAQIVLVSVNDEKYGGAGGTVGTFSAASSAPEIALHEFAHAYAGLADEYDDPYDGFPECGSECPEPNVSVFFQRDKNKWASWIESSTTLPTTTSDNTVVGAFEGARYKKTGVYRPISVCQMRQLGQLFCPVCAEALTLKVRSQVNPLENRVPAEESLTASACETIEFSVTPLEVDPDDRKLVWKLDDNEVGDKEKLSLDLSGVAPGEHTLVAHLEDNSPLVRSDPQALMDAEQTWKITVEESPCDMTDSGDETSTTGTTSGSTTDSSATDTVSETGSETATTGTGTATQTDTTTTTTTGTDTTSSGETTTDGGTEGEDNTTTVTCSCDASSKGYGWSGVLFGVAFALRSRRRR